MNGLYFPNSTYPDNEKLNDNNKDKTRNFNESYIEDILKNNKGKKIHIYCAFPDNEVKDFEGILEGIGSDYIILSNPVSGKWIIIMIMYLNYIEFEEKINN